MARKNCAHLFLTFATIFAVQGAMAANTTHTTNSAVATYGRPLSFEPNRGQTGKQVDFLAHGTGYRLFLSHGEAVMALDRGVTVRMRPVGGKPSVSAEPLDSQASRSNYFIGNDPQNWRTGIANYAQVRYRNVYPRIDLIYYGNQRQLEYDFVVGLGGDPGEIVLNFEGAARPTLNSSGDLVMHTEAGDLRWRKPVAYQEINGRRKLIVCTYARKPGDRLAFQLAAYDRTKPLIIDPVLIYSTYLGGSGNAFGEGDKGAAIAVDTAGNAYVTGTTLSLDFPLKNAFQTSYLGAFNLTPNAFVTKFSAAGKLVYSTYLGGTGFGVSSLGIPFHGDTGNGIAVDRQGNAYITGQAGSMDFPTKNAFQSSNNGLVNAFLTKLNSSGNALVYSTYLGGNSEDSANAVAVDAYGNAYLTGFASSSNFPTKNAFQNTRRGNQNAFVTKFDQDGDELVYSTYLGGSITDSGNAIAVDGYGNAYVTGQTTSSDFPIKNAFQNTFKSTCTFLCPSAFVTKLSAAGTALVYSTYLGGSGSDVGNGIAVDSERHAFVTGDTNSSDFPTQNAFQHQLKGAANAFVTKFHYAGNSLFYSTYLGGTGLDTGNAIAVDAYDNAYVSGSTTSSGFPMKNAFQAKLKGPQDAFVTKFDAAGTALVYSSYLGGTDSDSGNGITIDAYGNAYVIGTTNSINFPIKNAFQDTLESPGGDAFVTKISAH